MTKMAEAAKNVPAENRWAVATQALTGGIVVTNKTMLDIIGRENYNKAIAQIWAGLGNASKEVADALGWTVDDAQSAAETVTSVAVVAMGPEFGFETVEASAEKTVLRSTKCPWWSRAQEMGISEDMCSLGDPAWSDALAKSLNPKVTVRLTKAMPRGDPYCEWVYELEE
jgi:hypothetical protein